MARRKARVGPTQKLVGYSILALLGAIIVWLLIQQSYFNPAVLVASRGVQPQAVSGQATAALAALFPEVSGFAPLAPMQSYGPENLSDKINGKAELYLSAGFKEMSCRSFKLSEAGKAHVEVFIYDMGSPQNAYAVFSSQRRPDSTSISLTANAYKTDNALFFTQGRFYVVDGKDPLGLAAHLGDSVTVGAPLDRRAIDDRMAEIRRSYQRAGFDQASVRAIPKRRDDGSWLVVVELEPGVQRALTEVQFSGLRHIKPRYLRPGLQLAEGDLLNVFEVDESAIRIANFAPVERLDVTTRPTGTGGGVVDFDVFEKPRWTVELGVGWDNDRGVEVRTGVRDDNLFGRGVGANLRLTLNNIENAALLYTSLPPLPGRRLSFASTLGYTTGEGEDPYDNIQEEQYLASVEALYELAPLSSIKGYYRITKTFPSSDDPFLDLLLSDLTVATLGSAFSWDRFDNPFDPRSGYGVVTDVGWSSSYLGSDLDSIRTVLNLSLALEPARDWTWVQTGRIGMAEPLRGSELTPDVKFYAGGQGSIRGFEFNLVGPYIDTPSGPSPLGGGALFILNEELRTPLWRSLRGAIFVDAGQVWRSWSVADTQLSMAVGLGLRWSTPIGLVWGDVAWPVANVGVSSRNPKYYVGIGKPF